ncbi:NAD(P)/FAD-dependent oxidoreductase [Piscicoccus intestinalis]|uniref:NAD(P)/FAD-dependent oxidoreductase n=1 Tax=Piscicoccus intestinalis TaxID=746033 RepID=UPI0008380448|nr:FAD-dependent oxidoreductase [Piscicoccus intestinalis]
MSGIRSVAVVGAGMAGLATAWHLQERGAQVTVFDRGEPGAGSSWGNAGWLTPAIATPLPEPAVLRYGVRALASPSSPVYVPPTADPRLARFVAGFVRHSTTGRWQRAMTALLPLNERALEAFERLEAGGVAASTAPADPFIAGYSDVRNVKVLLDEFADIAEAGGTVDHELISGQEARRLEPTVSEGVEAAILIRGQRYLHPIEFVAAVAESVRGRGGDIVTGTSVRSVDDIGAAGVRLRTGDTAAGPFDAVVIANGAWLNDLVRPFGVRHVVQAGRGYSFSVPAQSVPRSPLYFPEVRVACTPLGNRLRVAGMMEFRRPDEPIDPRRIQAIVDSARELLHGVDLEDRRDEWVGSRPCTADGLPLVGRTTSPRVFVAGGHGMWGITLGPLTGELLAEQIVTGEVPDALTPLDPLRRLDWAPSRLRRRSASR